MLTPRQFVDTELELRRLNEESLEPVRRARSAYEQMQRRLIHHVRTEVHGRDFDAVLVNLGDEQNWYVKLETKKNYKNPRLEWVMLAYDRVTVQMMRIARANKPDDGPLRWLATCIEKNLKSMTTGEHDVCIESTQLLFDRAPPRSSRVATRDAPQVMRANARVTQLARQYLVCQEAMRKANADRSKVAQHIRTTRAAMKVKRAHVELLERRRAEYKKRGEPYPHPYGIVMKKTMGRKRPVTMATLTGKKTFLLGQILTKSIDANVLQHGAEDVSALLCPHVRAELEKHYAAEAEAYENAGRKASVKPALQKTRAPNAKKK